MRRLLGRVRHRCRLLCAACDCCTILPRAAAPFLVYQTLCGPCCLLPASPGRKDFGARDPTAGELGSNFGDKVLGNYNTEHIIK